jgi:hypothetical protein
MPITVEGLDPIISRFKEHPRKVNKALRTTMEAALLTLWENVPPYPPQPDTDYARTGTLGRTLGVGQGGGLEGFPDIYEVKQHSSFWEASFGTRLEYAPYVIGDPQNEQASHMSYWWTLPVTVVNRSLAKIQRLFIVMTAELARWLAKGGL